VEFLEYVARCAFAKFCDEPEMPLSLKIEEVLDCVFAAYGLKRKEAEENVGDDSSSDESVFIQEEEIE
jgi:hypothetical protein